jgi:hypothetical protein
MQCVRSQAIAGEVKEKAASGIEPNISGLPNFTRKATQ